MIPIFEMDTDDNAIFVENDDDVFVCLHAMADEVIDHSAALVQRISAIHDYLREEVSHP